MEFFHKKRDQFPVSAGLKKFFPLDAYVGSKLCHLDLSLKNDM